MISKLAVLAQRRAHLIANIDRERESLRGTYAVIRQDLVYAGLGLMAGKLMARHAWLRTASLVALAIVAGSRLAVKQRA
jgi:hypothetical protein